MQYVSSRFGKSYPQCLTSLSFVGYSVLSLIRALVATPECGSLNSTPSVEASDGGLMAPKAGLDVPPRMQKPLYTRVLASMVTMLLLQFGSL